MPCHCGSRSTRVLKLSLLSSSFQNQAYNHSGVLAMPRTTFKEKVPKRHLDQMPEPPQLAPFDVEQRLLSKSTSSLSLSSLWKAPSRTTEGSIQLFWGLRRNLQIIRLKFTGAHLDRMVGSNMHRTFCRKSVIHVFFFTPASSPHSTSFKLLFTLAHNSSLDYVSHFWNNLQHNKTVTKHGWR